jgi:hypothetical protein
MLFVEFETAALLATRHFSLVRLCKWPMFSFFPLGIVSTICFSLSLTLPIAQTLLQQFDIQLHIRVHFDEKRLTFYSLVSIYRRRRIALAAVLIRSDMHLTLVNKMNQATFIHDTQHAVLLESDRPGD